MAFDLQLEALMYCGFCGTHDHIIKNRSKTASGQANQNAMHCGYCGNKEHSTIACPKTFYGNAARAWHPETVEGDFIRDKECNYF